MRTPTLLLLNLILITPALFATTVSTSGRQLVVNGQAFTVKGVNYSAVPEGYTGGANGTNCLGQYHWWTDRPTYLADFPQIHRLGANTIRTFDLMNSTVTATEVRQALDAAQANGLYVIMGYYVSHTADPFHPVMTVEGECLAPDCGGNFTFLKNIGNTAIEADDAHLTFLDVWGINSYRGQTFEGVFQALAACWTN